MQLYKDQSHELYTYVRITYVDGEKVGGELAFGNLELACWHILNLRMYFHLFGCVCSKSGLVR